jgi:hypothetical protein
MMLRKYFDLSKVATNISARSLSILSRARLNLPLEIITTLSTPSSNVNTGRKFLFSKRSQKAPRCSEFMTQSFSRIS